MKNIQNLKPAHVPLSLPPQQARAVEWLIRGLRVREIASRMNISPHTVRAYLDRAQARLGAASRTALVIEYYRQTMKR
jgi:DNA-binding CsgD family transcriptional regulator